MSQPNDSYGRTVTLATSNGQDVYTITEADSTTFTLSYPAGTIQGIVYAAINSMAPGNYVAPASLLSQTLSPQQFGAYVVQQFQAAEIIRNLTPGQRKTLDNSLGPYAVMLNSGDIAGFLSEIPTITVDGTIVTSVLITQITNLVQGYLNGTV